MQQHTQSQMEAGSHSVSTMRGAFGESVNKVKLYIKRIKFHNDRCTTDICVQMLHVLSC